MLRVGWMVWVVVSHRDARERGRFHDCSTFLTSEKLTPHISDTQDSVLVVAVATLLQLQGILAALSSLE